MAWLLVPDVPGALRATPPRTRSSGRSSFGALWGLGGLTFGLTVRYLGIALGVAVALGLCNAFGTLVPPIVSGDFAAIAGSRSGRVILAGVLVSLVGIAVSGLAGVSKERRTVRGGEAGGGAGIQLRERHAGRDVLRNHERVLRVRARGRRAARRGHAGAAAGVGPERPVAEPARADRGACRRLHHELRLVRHPQRAEPHRRIEYFNRRSRAVANRRPC